MTILLCGGVLFDQILLPLLLICCEELRLKNVKLMWFCVDEVSVNTAMFVVSEEDDASMLKLINMMYENGSAHICVEHSTYDHPLLVEDTNPKAVCVSLGIDQWGRRICRKSLGKKKKMKGLLLTTM